MGTVGPEGHSTAGFRCFLVSGLLIQLMGHCAVLDNKLPEPFYLNPAFWRRKHLKRTGQRPWRTIVVHPWPFRPLTISHAEDGL